MSKIEPILSFLNDKLANIDINCKFRFEDNFFEDKTQSENRHSEFYL